MSHKFKIGQHVRQARIGYADAANIPAGPFVVVRLMPEDRTGEVSYRVKSAAGERVMREGEITLAF